jgi:hypothetical protein
MPGRDPSNRGVGRGNGPGSRASQFQAGRPSGNPRGRPRKPKVQPNGSIKDAVAKSLAELITTRENGVASKRSQAEAMIMLLFNNYPSATTHGKLATLKFIGEVAPGALLEQSHDLPKTAIADLVAILAKEAKRDEKA